MIVVMDRTNAPRKRGGVCVCVRVFGCGHVLFEEVLDISREELLLAHLLARSQALRLVVRWLTLVMLAPSSLMAAPLQVVGVGVSPSGAVAAMSRLCVLRASERVSSSGVLVLSLAEAGLKAEQASCVGDPPRCVDVFPKAASPTVGKNVESMFTTVRGSTLQPWRSRQARKAAAGRCKSHA